MKISTLSLDSMIRNSTIVSKWKERFLWDSHMRFPEWLKIVFKVISQALYCSLGNHFPRMNRIMPMAFSKINVEGQESPTANS